MYELDIREKSLKYLDKLSDKSKRIVKENLKILTEYPYPGRGKGDKEKLDVPGHILYRMNIGRSHTAFYKIHEKERIVEISRIMTMEKAHKLYGRL
jgi:mRNA-degrading endonuclease RelE of RelBE toxin-antitoxin system